jgi:hypothetical protein
MVDYARRAIGKRRVPSARRREVVRCTKDTQCEWHDVGEGSCPFTYRVATLKADGMPTAIRRKLGAGYISTALLVIALAGMLVLVTAGTAVALSRTAKSFSYSSPLQNGPIVCASTTFCMQIEADPDSKPQSSIWNGSRWSTPTTVPSFVQANSNDFSCVSPIFCVTGGYSGGQTGVAMWNGSNWRFVPLYAAPAGYSAINPPIGSLSCATGGFCLAVGASVFAWNGSQWDKIPTAAQVPFEENDGSVTGCSISDTCLEVPLDSGATLNLFLFGGGQLTTVNFPQSPSHPSNVILGMSCSLGPGIFCMVMALEQGSAGSVSPTVNLADFNGTTWSSVQALNRTPGDPFVPSIACAEATACIANGVGPSGSKEVWNGQTWRAVPSSEFTLVSCAPAGGCISPGLPLTSATRPLIPKAVTRGPSRTSSVATALATPSEAFSSISKTLENAAITVGAIAFITFPAQLFNSTLDENYEEIIAMWRRFMWKLWGKRREARKGPPTQDRALSTPSKKRELATFTSVVLVGSLVGGFRDPKFGINLASVANFLGTVVSIVALIAAPALAATGYRKLRGKPTYYTWRALPAGIAIAVASVLVSRLTHFEPGYLYGLVCGIAFAHRLAKSEEAHVVTLESLATLGIAVLAWIIFVPVDRAALGSGSNFGIVLVDDFLACVFVGGLVGLAIGMLPLKFLPGGTLYQWKRGVWAVMIAVSMFGIIAIMLRPSSASEKPSNSPFVATIILFAVFGGLSVAFRQYFAHRRGPGDDESRVTASTGAGRFR